MDRYFGLARDICLDEGTLSEWLHEVLSPRRGSKGGAEGPPMRDGALGTEGSIKGQPSSGGHASN